MIRTRQILMTAVAGIGVAVAGVSVSAAPISYVTITNDADSGISSTNDYTHAIDFGATGSGATVNGQAFIRVDNAVGTLGAAPFLDYTGNNGVNEASNDGTAVSVKSGDMAGLMQGFVFQNGSGSGVGTLQVLTLSGLTVGTEYDFRLYLGEWRAGASSRTTNITFDHDGAGGTSESTGVFNIDNPTDIGIATNATYYVNYRYVATAEDLVVSAEIQVNNNSMHIYALTNQVVPEPGSLALLGLGGLLIGSRRRRA